MSEVKDSVDAAYESCYFSTISRGVEVFHDKGILQYYYGYYGGIGQFVSAVPLTPGCPSFSFKILHAGKQSWIAIGVCPKDYPPTSHIGWNKGSAGYFAGNGSVFVKGSCKTSQPLPCEEGDVLQCQLDFSESAIFFSKNGKKVHQLKVELSFLSGLHAAVGMASPGETVMLLEKTPWRPCP